MRKRLLIMLLAAVLVSGTLTVLNAEADTRLDWQECPGDNPAEMECASLDVPVDWAKPDGRKITLELGRLPRTGTHSTGAEPAKGSVLVAYGGPGGPGIAITQQNPELWAELRQRMDVVTWDTRGYGEQFGGTSTGLDCTWTRLPIPNVPADAAEFGRLAQDNFGTAYACRTRDPEFFDAMSSADHARDMEAIRVALGEPKINFYGASYATFYGQTYARLFPDRVRTMVLDGGFSNSPTEASGGWTGELIAHAKRNEQTIGRFFDWCESDRDCALSGRNVERSWQRLLAKAKRTPLRAEREDETYYYDDADLRGIGLGLARRKSWPELAKAIDAALHGDASDFVPARPESPYPDLPTGITECLDMPRIKSYEEAAGTVKRLERIAPNVGAVGTMAKNTLQCVGWPTPVTNPPAPLPDGLPPFLTAGAWDEFDALEPVADQVPDSGSIFHGDSGHTLYPFNECARGHIDRYFVDQVVPPRGTRC